MQVGPTEQGAFIQSATAAALSATGITVNATLGKLLAAGQISGQLSGVTAPILLNGSGVLFVYPTSGGVVTLLSGSIVTTISGNTIATVTSGSVVTTLSGSIVTPISGNGIITTMSGSVVTLLSGSQLSVSGNVVQVLSGSAVTTLSGSIVQTLSGSIITNYGQNWSGVGFAVGVGTSGVPRLSGGALFIVGGTLDGATFTATVSGQYVGYFLPVGAQGERGAIGILQSGPIVVNISGQSIITSGSVAIINSGSVVTTLSGSIVTPISGNGIITTMSGSVTIINSGSVISVVSGSIVQTLSGAVVTTLSGSVTTISGNVVTLSGSQVVITSGLVKQNIGLTWSGFQLILVSGVDRSGIGYTNTVGLSGATSISVSNGGKIAATIQNIGTSGACFVAPNVSAAISGFGWRLLEGQALTLQGSYEVTARAFVSGVNVMVIEEFA